MSDIQKFQVGDVVYADGASAINGDVTAVRDEEFVRLEYHYITVVWRKTETEEDSEDLTLVERDGKKVE